MIQKLLTSKEAAELLNTSVRHVLALARKGEMPSVKVGKFVRFRLSDIERYIELQRKRRLFQ